MVKMMVEINGAGESEACMEWLLMLFDSCSKKKLSVAVDLKMGERKKGKAPEIQVPEFLANRKGGRMVRDETV